MIVKTFLKIEKTAYARLRHLRDKIHNDSLKIRADVKQMSFRPQSSAVGTICADGTRLEQVLRAGLERSQTMNPLGMV